MWSLIQGKLDFFASIYLEKSKCRQIFWRFSISSTIFLWTSLFSAFFIQRSKKPN